METGGPKGPPVFVLDISYSVKDDLNHFTSLR